MTHDTHYSRTGPAVPRPTADPVAFVGVRQPVTSGISKPLYRQFSQDVCPWNVKFARDATEPAFAARAFIAGKDVRTLAMEILAMSQEEFSAAFRNSPMKRAKLAGLQRNARVVLGGAKAADGM